jgi:hypothetical protein
MKQPPSSGPATLTMNCFKLRSVWRHYLSVSVTVATPLGKNRETKPVRAGIAADAVKLSVAQILRT